MYIDPGLGGMLVQLAVAIVATGGAVAFFMRKKIRALFSKNKESDIPEETGIGAGNIEDDAIDMIPDNPDVEEK